MTTILINEQTANRADASRRTTELRNAIRRLWPDRDDSFVLCEIHSLLGQLRQAEAELTSGGDSADGDSDDGDSQHSQVPEPTTGGDTR